METVNANQQVPPVQNSVQSQLPSSPNSPAPSKIFITVLCAVLLLMIGIGSYVLGIRKSQTAIQNQQPTIPQSSPTPISDDTANWKTYTNTDYGYELQYPPTWKIEIPSNTSGIGKESVFVNLISDTRIVHEKIGNPPYSVGISIYDNSENKSITEIDKQVNTNITYQEETINAMKAYRIARLSQQFDDLKIYYQRVYLKTKDKNYVSMSFAPFNPDKPLANQESQYKIFNQILSTFKFLDQKQTTSSSLEYRKRQFDINEKFYPPQNYPPQLINIPEDDLVAMKCTPQYLRQIDGTYAYSYPLIKLDDSSLLQLINEASKTVSNGAIYGFTSCVTVDNKIILEYETWSGGGGSQNVVYFGVKKLDGSIEKVVTIPAAIFCVKPLQLTRDDVFYYQCGAYENAGFIYKILISKHSYELLFTCEGVDIGTDNARVVCK